MKKVNVKSIRKGNYVKISKKEGNIDNKYWTTTYLKVKRKRGENVFSDKWVDFNSKGKFINVFTVIDGVEDCSIFKVYKLSKKEYYQKVGKYLIIWRL